MLPAPTYLEAIVAQNLSFHGASDDAICCIKSLNRYMEVSAKLSHFYFSV
jgi:hypothetical protein